MKKNGDYDYIVKIKGKKRIVRYGTIAWGLITVGGALALLSPLFAFYISAFIFLG